jgi:hypothetical protein
LKAEEIEMVEKEMRDYDKTIKLSDQAHRSKMNQIRSDLSQKSELARYSTAIDRLCQDIEANVHQFRSKPIGPLGRHIKLTQEAARNDKLNSLLEIQLGQKNLKSFLVECKEDQRVLDNLMRKHWHLKAKQPMITTRKRLLHTYYILSYMHSRSPKSQYLSGYIAARFLASLSTKLAAKEQKKLLVVWTVF